MTSGSMASVINIYWMTTALNLELHTFLCFRWIFFLNYGKEKQKKLGEWGHQGKLMWHVRDRGGQAPAVSHTQPQAWRATENLRTDIGKAFCHCLIQNLMVRVARTLEWRSWTEIDEQEAFSTWLAPHKFKQLSWFFCIRFGNEFVPEQWPQLVHHY